MYIQSLSELRIEHNYYLTDQNGDESYQLLLEATGGQLDLAIPEHGEVLLVWLRKWGCRQFAIAYTNQSLDAIRAWYKDFHKQLPPYDMHLLDIKNEKMMDDIATSYDSLRERVVSKRKKDIDVRSGPTGASKILFALRPNSLPPWDDPIRKSALKHILEKKGGEKLKENGRSYALFMCYLQDILRDFEKQSLEPSMSLQDLPKELGSDKSTLVKILDEHLWTTVTRAEEYHTFRMAGTAN